MADEEKRITYVIRVISEGGEGEGESLEASSKSDVAGGDKKKKKSFGEMNAYEKYKSITKIAAVGYAAKMANNVITNEVSRVELRTGNAILQQKIEYAKNTTLRAAGTVGALVAGFATANPLLIAGAMTSIADYAFDVHQKQVTLNLQRQLESVSIGMANIRAGANGSRGRKDQI